MKIESFDLSFYSQHSFIQKDVEQQSLLAWQGARRPDFDGQGSSRIAGGGDQFTLSSSALAAQPKKVVAKIKEDNDDSTMSDLRMAILAMMVERITGRAIQVVDPAELNPDKVELPEEVQQLAQAQQGASRAGYGIEYDYYASHYEYEQTTFSAEGIVRTKDGQEIRIDIDLSMTREFYQETSISYREGDAVVKDPLIVNFAGTSAQLTQTHFEFDIDLDGRRDQIAFVGPGSGFLALDSNNDGMVNDGGELFGPRTGNGFNELAAYDDDGNNWIDELDRIFDRLRIWSKEPDGSDKLVALGKAGIGAIYLGNLATPHEMKNNADLLGLVRSSGIYLHDDGTPGTMQQVDLVI